MRRLRRLILVAQPWLTAIMVVIAGMPHDVCACAFCEAAPAHGQPQPCCCAETPSASEAAAKNKHRAPTPCCCCSGEEQTAQSTSASGEIKPPSCLKEPAPQE